MSYKIAIPSKGRPDLCRRTVNNLIENGIRSDWITVFLETVEDRNAYDLPVIKIVHERPGIVGARNAITDWYPDGERIISIDDDVTVISRLNKRLLEPVTELPALFEQCWKVGGELWGVNPTVNPFYMQNKVRRGLVFCCGFLHGYINDKSIQLKIETKEDYERSIRYFEKFGTVTRFDFLTGNNKYGATAGGLGPDREDRNRLAAAALLKGWPQYVAYRKGSDTEVRLRIK